MKRHQSAPQNSLCTLLLRCRKGLSHHPDEYASPAHMAAGVQTLAIALAQLAGGATSGGDSADRTEL